MFAGTNWFDGKSIDGAAPFGPVIVPKEFLPNAGHLKISTKVNGVVLQDSNTDQLIWDEAHLVAYLTSRLTLYPGDVIVTGTPGGVGVKRTPPLFVEAGDVVADVARGPARCAASWSLRCGRDQQDTHGRPGWRRHRRIGRLTNENGG